MGVVYQNFVELLSLLAINDGVLLKTIWVFKLKFLQCPSLNASEYQFFGVVQVSRSEIWRMPSWQREEQGRCLSCLVLDLSTTPQNGQPSHGSSFEYCFRRATTASTPATCSFLERPFSCGDHVVMFFPHIQYLCLFLEFISNNKSAACCCQPLTWWDVDPGAVA